MFLASGFYALLKALNAELPAEEWSPPGQRLHHLIGFLPDTLQAFLFLMGFKAVRHLTFMPTLWTVLIYAVQEERKMRTRRRYVTSAQCHTISRKM